MKNLIIYDETGFIVSMRSGEPQPREPIGIPFLWVDIPEGKQLKITDGIGIDVSVTPHRPFLEDLPLTEVAILELQVAQLQYQLMMSGVL